MRPRGVSSLKLTAFRSYETCVFDLEPTSAVLIGPNGVGKTTLLEALSFLTPGRGMRRARLSEVQCDRNTTEPWAVAASLESPEGILHIGTGRASLVSERRVVRVNGVTLKTQTELSQHVHVTWLTPQMDRLFVEGASGRRRFLDRLVFGVDPLHARRVLRYEQALRERHRLLELPFADSTWFKALEDILSAEGVAITVARLQLIHQLNQVLEKRVTSFPQARLVLEGPLEAELGQGTPALRVEETYAATLAQNRGATPPGCHRSDLIVFHKNGRTAALCSTGEQKSLLISLILAASTLQMQQRQTIPLLLLDEIIAHLDPQRRGALFEDLLQLRLQIWMTGTDAALFSGLQDNVQLFYL